MATLQSKVEDYTGAYSDTDALTNWLTQGARILIDILPQEKLEKISTSANFSNSASLAFKRPLYVHVGGYEAREIKPGYKTQAAASGSIYYATATDPVYYSEAGNITVLPNGTGTLVYVAYPIVSYGDTNINLMPIELEQIVVLYTAIQAQIAKMMAKNTLLTAIAVSAVSTVSTVTAPSFTYTDATLGSYVNALIADFGTVPTYTKPTTTFDITQTGADLTAEDIELANAEMNKQNTLLQKYSSDIQNEVNEFNNEVVAYNAKVQKELQQAQMIQQSLLSLAEATTNLSLANEAKDLEKQVQEYASKLQKFQLDLQSYSAQVQQEGQRISSLLQQYGQGYKQEQELLNTLKAEYNMLLQLQIGIGAKNG